MVGAALVDGPYGRAALPAAHWVGGRPWGLLFVAGGVGITALVAALDAALPASQTTAGEETGRLPGSSPSTAVAVRLVWSVRDDPAAFDFWLPGLLDGLEARGASLALHVTMAACAKGGDEASEPQSAGDEDRAAAAAASRVWRRGRPDVGEQLAELAGRAGRPGCALPGSHLAVIACGPPGLLAGAHAAARRMGAAFDAAGYEL